MAAHFLDVPVYVVWALTWSLVWLLLFGLRKESRREMMITSLIFAPLGPVAMYFHVIDYFDPQTLFDSPWSIENWVIGFTNGGIGAVLYEQVCRHGRFSYSQPGSVLPLLTAVPLGVGWMGTSVFFLNFSSLYAAVIFMLIVGLSMLLLRPRLIPNAVISGVLFALFLWLFYFLFQSVYPDFFTRLWHTQGLSGISIIGIPVEEILWGFTVGFMLGPASELAAQMYVGKLQQK